MLGASEGAEAFPLGEIRLALAGAMLAARRGERDRALDAARAGRGAARSIPFIGGSSTEPRPRSHLALGEWSEAAAVAERVLTVHATALWRARFVMYGVVAEVELALDARARREPFDAEATAARLRGRIDDARDAADARRGAEEALDSAAHLAHAAAAVTRLGDSDPEAWAEAARRWADLGDPYWLATARVREAEAAAAVGRDRTSGRGAARGAPTRGPARRRSAVDGHRGRVATDPTQRRTRRSRPHSTTPRSITSASRPERPRSSPSSRPAGRTDRSARPCSCPRRPRASTSRTSCASSVSAAESTPPRSRNASAST